jgi:DNA recombination protein RmuC
MSEGLLTIVIILLVALIVIVLRRPKDEQVTILQDRVVQLQKVLSDGMGQTQQDVRQQLASTSGIVRDVTEKLTRMEETNKQVLDVTAQLQSLQDMLRNPKQRGIVGEFYLETLLQNVLPPNGYEMQYKFKDGEVVDAVVFVKDKIVPIDSKFSLENYNRIIDERNPAEREKLEKLLINDLKERIKETAKYIRPEEGTMDFAFMFIPHEAIYYDLLINKIGMIGEDTENIVQRAASKYHVIIVSPTSFLAYLQTVLQGLKALQIEEQAKEIRIRVGDIGRHLSAYDSYFKGIGKNLGTTVNQYNLASKELSKIDKDVLRITGTSSQIEPALLEKPEASDD